MRPYTALLLLLAPVAFAAGPTAPATKPAADADVDWILGQGKAAAPSKPDAGPASRPSSPFAGKKDDNVRFGTITLSNGEKISGKLAHTADKPFRVWVESEGEYHDIPYKLIQSVEAKVLSEHDEKEWHFKESGSDVKEFTGKSYPVRETQYTLTLLNGQTLTGGIVEPLYLETREGQSTFSLLKRDKGAVGQDMKKLVYVKRVDFGETKPVETK
ncbi:MAG TPA: hypothetical protein VG269_05990 [Tepidisphaeraceae bacterium]|jgi:hypothetical protein|nr:hypothetical protein [Tepidisphaeraceae bacterium]